MADQLVVAERIEALSPRSVFHLDEVGNVRGPTPLQRAQWTLLRTGRLWAPAAGMAALLALGAGALPLFLGGFLSGVWLHLRAWHWIDLHWAIIHQVQGRLDQAEKMARTVRASPLAGRKPHLAAEIILGNLAVRRGRWEEGLGHYRAARLLRRGRGNLGSWEALGLQEAVLLCNLGQVAAARELLRPRLEREPEGDFLRLQQWTVELYVCLCEGTHGLGAEALERRAAEAWRVPTAAPLLALCAWAMARVGNLARTRELLREALDRSAELDLDRRTPRLHEWMQAHASWATADGRF